MHSHPEQILENKLGSITSSMEHHPPTYLKPLIPPGRNQVLEFVHSSLPNVVQLADVVSHAGDVTLDGPLHALGGHLKEQTQARVTRQDSIWGSAPLPSFSSALSLDLGAKPSTL